MADRVGQQLGNYRLVRLLGQGGFADVYLGQHIHLDTQAALKVLNVQMGNDERESFHREARIIAHLAHPHIIRVLDFGVDDKTPFLVMDYAPHGTLRQRYPRGTRVPLANIVSHVREIAEALQFAHYQRLIHRDIKPENILLGSKNEILLSDFGIVVVQQTTSKQFTTEGIGTAPYMAPEQIMGAPHIASDQYALGVLVYEWLCGFPPFQGGFLEVFFQHLNIPPRSLLEQVPTIPPPIEAVVMIALSKVPQQRFASVRAFANALEQASRDEVSILLNPNHPSPLLLPVQPALQLSTASAFEDSSSSDTPPAKEKADPSSVAQQVITPREPERNTHFSERALSGSPPFRVRQPGHSSRKTVFLAGLVLLVVALSSGGIYSFIALHNAALLQATTTARASNLLPLSVT